LANSTAAVDKVTLSPLTDNGRCHAKTDGFSVVTPSGAPFDTRPPCDHIAAVGHPASLQLSKASGNDTLYWAAYNLPDGLRVDERTGLISGTPLRAGTYRVLFGADNGQGDTVTRAFSWIVTPD